MPNLYIDMDGVVADFDKKGFEILGMPPRVYEKKYGTIQYWAELQAVPDFYNSFDPMPDAFELWAAVKHLDPIFLTGVPRGLWGEAQKRVWIHRHFGKDRPFIACKAKQKSRFCNPGDVIVDDKNERYYHKLWSNKGGIWVIHTSAKESIDQLKNLGIIQ